MARKRPSPADYGTVFKAGKSASNLLVLFIPSQARDEKPIDQEHWRDEALYALGRLFGGATAYPKGKGVWRDDEQGGRLLFDEPVVVQCYTTEKDIRRQARALRSTSAVSCSLSKVLWRLGVSILLWLRPSAALGEFLVRMGTECRQGAVGFVIDRDYLEIRFPLSGKGE